MPRQIVLEYAWREEVAAGRARSSARFDGQTHHDALRRNARVQRQRQRAVLDDEARLAAVRRQARRRGKIAERWKAAVAEGTARRDGVLDNLAGADRRRPRRRVVGSAKGLIGVASCRR